MTWHVDHATVERYVRNELDATSGASLETHVIGCDECRGLFTRMTDQPLLDEVWLGVVDTLDQPRLSPVERALVWMRVSPTTARVVAATSRARWSYLIAVALSLLFAWRAWTSGSARPLGEFLVVAPLGPLVATATAFGRRSDPMYELGTTVPASSLRLLLVRTAAAVVPAIALLGVGVPWLAIRGWIAIAWLLPSLALAVGALALSTWMEIETASIVLAVLWLAVPLAVRLDATELLDALRGPVQIASIVAVIVAGAVTMARRSAFEYREL